MNMALLNGTAEHGLKGTKIILKYPSVGTTENIILAAVMAKGRNNYYERCKRT